MLVFVLVFVVSPIVAEADFPCEPCFREKFEGAIDGCLAHARIFLLYELIEIFVGEVFFTAKKDVENQVALSGALESFFLNVPKKDFLFFSHRFGARHVEADFNIPLERIKGSIRFIS